MEDNEAIGSPIDHAAEESIEESVEQPSDDQAKGKRGRNNLRFWCDICKVSCASAVNLQTHFIGFRHKMVEEALKLHAFPAANEKKSDNTDDSGSSENPNVRLPADVIKDLTRRPKKKFPGAVECLEDQLNSSTEPVIGLDYVIEYRSESDVPYMYECTICKCTTGMTNMFMHVVGYKHRYAYLQLKYPEMVGPAAPKSGYPRILEKLKEKAAYIEKMEGRQSLQVVTVPDSKKRKRGMWLQDRLKELTAESATGDEILDDSENILQQRPEPDFDNIEDAFEGEWGGQPITQFNVQEAKKPKKVQESPGKKKEEQIRSAKENESKNDSGVKEGAKSVNSKENQKQQVKETEKKKPQTAGEGLSQNQKASNKGGRQQTSTGILGNKKPPPLMSQKVGEFFIHPASLNKGLGALHPGPREPYDPYMDDPIDYEKSSAEQSLLEQSELRILNEALIQSPALMRDMDSSYSERNCESVLRILMNKAGLFSFLNNFEIVTDDDAAFVLNVTRLLTVALVSYREQTQASQDEKPSIPSLLDGIQDFNRAEIQREKKSKWDPSPSTPASRLAARVASRQEELGLIHFSSNKESPERMDRPASGFNATRGPASGPNSAQQPVGKKPLRPTGPDASTFGPSAHRQDPQRRLSFNQPAGRPLGPRKGNTQTDALMSALAKDSITSRFLSSLKGMNILQVEAELRKIAATNPAFRGIHIPTVLNTLAETGYLDTKY